MDKEYLDFVERMGSFEFELGLNDIGEGDNIAHSNLSKYLSKTPSELQHHGVKGMKWGVRRSDEQLARAKLKRLDKEMKDTKDPKKLKSLQKEYGKVEDSIDYSQNGLKKKINDNLASQKRERSWSKSMKDIESMSTKDLNEMARRIQLENDMKRLTKKSSGVATKQDRQDYLDRANLSDQDLNLRVNRLRAKANFARTVGDASKEQRETGFRIANTVAGAGLKYALTGSLGTKDLAKIALKSKDKNNFKDIRNIALDKALDNVDYNIIERR
jgi:hypothetical protein